MIAAAHVRDDAQVQPKAATAPAHHPRDLPAARVNSTPLPGDTMTINDVPEPVSWLHPGTARPLRLSVLRYAVGGRGVMAAKRLQ